jgi:YesN/AraC family two-component response regulator
MHSVLVVDDEPFVRLSLASLRDWKREGFDFHFEAGNGLEALTVLSAHPEIDILLLDISMPVLDGIGLLRRLASGQLQRETGLPAVIVLSAYDEYHLVRTAFTLGARDYLLKSELEGETLLAMLKKTAGCLGRSPLAARSPPQAARSKRSAAVLERTQLEALRARVLRELLLQPPSPGSGELLAGLGLELSAPFHPCALWIRDFEMVAGRFQGEGLSRFSELVQRSLVQVLARRGGGELVTVRPDHAVALFQGSAEAARAFCLDAAENLQRYLSVQAEFSVGRACQRLEELPAAYREAAACRRVESRIVVAAKRIMREKFADPELGLARIAGEVGVSKNHLSWEFAREAGQTVTGYLAGVRIAEAKRLLSSTALKVYEVGERVGYRNVEHFSRIFKKWTGSSPSSWEASREPEH